MGIKKTSHRTSPTKERSPDALSRTIFEEAADGILLCSDRGRIIEINPRACQMLGYSRRQLLKKSVQELIPQEELRKNPLKLNDLRVGERITTERYIKRKDRTLFPVELASRKLPDGNILAVARDISDRKAAEEHLRDLAIFPDQNPYPLLRLSQGGVILYANESSQSLLRDWGTSVGRKAPLFWRKKVAEAFVNRRPEIIDVSMDEGVFALTVVPVIDASYINLYGNDVTDRKRSEQEVKRLIRIHTVLSNINQAIVRTHDTRKLFEEACRIAVEDGKFQLAWIGEHNHKTQRVDIAGFGGPASEYLKNINIDLNDDKRGRGPTGRAIRSGVHFVSNDWQHDEATLPWRAASKKFGFRSSASFPMKVFGRVWGAFNVYSNETAFFNDDEIRLFDDLAMDISFAVEAAQEETERQRAENVLEKQHRYIETVLENAPIGFAVHTIGDGVSQYVSARFEEIYGVPHGSLRTVNDFFATVYTDPVFREQIRSRVMADMATGDPARMRWENIPVTTQKGEKKVITAINIPVLDQGLMVSTVQDVTERARAEDELRHHQHWLEQAERIAHVGGWAINMQTGSVWGSAEAHRIYGLEGRDITMSDIQSLPLPEYRTRLNDALNALIRKGEPYDVEFRITRRSDGALLDIHSQAEYDPASRIVFGIIQDITERKRADEELKEKENRMRMIVEGTPHLFFYTQDTQAKVTYVSPSVESITGHTVEEWCSQSHWFVTGNKINEYARRRTRAHLNGEITKGPIFVEVEHADKHPLLLEVYEHPVVSDGKVTGIQGVAHDITERRRAEEALRQSQKNYRDVVENATDIIYSINNEGRFQYANAAGLRMTGYTIEELVQRRYIDLIAPDHRGRVARTYIRQALKGESTSYLEFPIHTKAGELKWIGQNASVVYELGEVSGFHIIARDITQRVRTEEALRASEERFRSLFENVSLGIYRTTPDGRILLANTALVRMLGYESVLEFMQRNLETEDYFPQYSRSDFRHRIEQEGEIRGLESAWLRKDGARIYVRENARLARDSEGNVMYYEGTVEDVTERKQAEESLRRLNKAVEASGEVIFMTDRNGVFTFVNGEFTRLYGYQPEEVVGIQTPRILKSGRQSQEQYRLLWQSLTNKLIAKGEWVNRAKDGRFLTIEAAANPILDANGDVIGFLAIQRNVTEQRAMEEQIRQAQKMESIGTLASGIAHDFNNILGIIMGHASLIERFQSEPERLAASVATILNATRRGASVVRQMLTFARKSKVEFKPILINDSVAEIERLLRETFPRTLSLVCRLGENLPLITGDVTQVHQVLLNLCVNARDAMQGSGALTISTSHQSGEELHSRFVKAVHSSYVVVDVIDTGSGMDEETQKRIFEPFFTTKGVGSGTGLGLSVVFGIMESHGGFIDVVSKPGHGTTFSLYFPAESAPSVGTVTGVEPQKEVRGGTETVLVVEDEETLKEAVRLNLSMKGYTVLTAEDGNRAVEVYRNRATEIAVVVCDFGLPGYNGHEVLRRLKAINPDVKFILASGYIDPQEKSAILKDGARDFLQKPYIADDIMKKIRNVIDL